MNFNIYLNDELSNQMISYAEKQGISCDSLIHQAVEAFIQDKNQLWPDNILEFQGVPDFPALNPFERIPGLLIEDWLSLERH